MVALDVFGVALLACKIILGLDLNQEGETLTDSSECKPWGSPDLSVHLSLC